MLKVGIKFSSEPRHTEQAPIILHLDGLKLRRGIELRTKNYSHFLVFLARHTQRYHDKSEGPLLLPPDKI